MTEVLETCKKFNLTVNEYTFLYLNFYNLENNNLADVGNLVQKGFVFNNGSINIKKAKEVLGIGEINFWEFYNVFPHKVDKGTRILRAVNPDSKIALKHEQKYLKSIGSILNHKKACIQAKRYVEKQMKKDGGLYLPTLDRILNNKEWESWDFSDESKGLASKIKMK